MNKAVDLDVEWSEIEGEGLIRVVPTDSFAAGVGLAAKLAQIAERQNHDPDVLITNKKVVITLFSHDESTVTDRDYAYAVAVDKMLL